MLRNYLIVHKKKLTLCCKKQKLKSFTNRRESQIKKKLNAKKAKRNVFQYAMLLSLITISPLNYIAAIIICDLKKTIKKSGFVFCIQMLDCKGLQLKGQGIIPLTNTHARDTHIHTFLHLQAFRSCLMSFSPPLVGCTNLYSSSNIL